METEEDLVDRVIKNNHLGQRPAPSDSFKHTPAELDKGREEARAAFRIFPEPALNPDEAVVIAAQRYPAMGNVFALFCQGIEQSPGVIPGAAGNPDLWHRIADLDRLTGRLIWCGQLFTSGGEAGALTAAAAAQGVCEGAIKRASDLIAAPGTPEAHRNPLRAAFCEPARLAKEQQDREQQAEKTLAAQGQPLRTQVDEAHDRAAMARAIEGYLTSTGATP